MRTGRTVAEKMSFCSWHSGRAGTRISAALDILRLRGDVIHHQNSHGTAIVPLYSVSQNLDSMSRRLLE